MAKSKFPNISDAQIALRRSVMAPRGCYVLALLLCVAWADALLLSYTRSRAPSAPCIARTGAVTLSEPPPTDEDVAPPKAADPAEPAPPEPAPPNYDADFDAGVEFGQEIRSRFVSPRIDDPGLPYADVLTITCGTLFTSALALKGVIPRPGWLAPTPGLDWRGLPYILPTLSHAAALGGCWVLGALAASAFERSAYMGSLSEAIRTTWKAGAFASGVLLLCTQLSFAATLSAAGIDQYTPSEALDLALNQVAGEVFFDVFIAAGGLTAFRIYRWSDAQGRPPPPGRN